MRIFLRVMVVGLLLVGVPFPAVRAQSPQAKGASNPGAGAQQSPPVIRATTRLVQISVVVTDKKGQPITGLKKEDFTLLDEGKSEDIAFFTAEETTAKTAEGRPTLPPNVFTNRFDLKGQDPRSVTVVLFDSLNTAPEDQSYVRQQVIKFLKTLKPEDHVALYGLTTQLLLVHDFTQDAAKLVKAASQFEPSKSGAFEAAHPEFMNVPALSDDPSWAKFQAAFNRSNARIADQANISRAETTMEALERVADHVAAIPGHKSLVWVSGSFPLQVLLAELSVDRESRPLSANATRTGRALNRVDMSIYPVDASGVVGDPGFHPSNATATKCMDCIVEGTGPSSAMFARQNLRDTERMLADATGGQAFYGSNDITVAMRRVLDDGRYAYKLAFYPNHGQWDGKFRKIKIQVKANGAQPRYRKGYYANAETRNSETQAREALHEAAISPLDATSLGLIVSGNLSGDAAERKIVLHVGLDPRQLRLQKAEDHVRGDVDLYLVQRDDRGQAVAAESQRLGLVLEEKEYEGLSKAGMVLARHMTLDTKATELRVLLRDSNSEALGSVTIPVTALLGK